MEYQDIIISMFKDLVDEAPYDLSVIQKYFSEDFQQYIDGVKIEYPEFVERIKYYKRATIKTHTEIRSIVCLDSTVFTNHVSHIIRPNRKKEKVQVLAEFRLLDSKIYYCNELTHILSE